MQIKEQTTGRSGAPSFAPHHTLPVNILKYCRYRTKHILVASAACCVLALYALAPFSEAITFEVRARGDNEKQKIMTVIVENSGSSRVWCKRSGNGEIAEYFIWKPDEDGGEIDLLTGFQGVAHQPSRYQAILPGEVVEIDAYEEQWADGEYKIQFTIKDWRGKEKNIAASFLVKEGVASPIRRIPPVF